MNRAVIVFLLLGLALVSCKKNRLKVDLSGIEVSLQIVRFEPELFGRSPSELADSTEAIRHRTGDFFDLYTYEVIGIGGYGEEHFNDELLRFVTDTVYSRVVDSLNVLFGDFSKHKKKFEKAFRYYRYHFPNKPIPVLYTQMSGFNQSLIIDNDMIGISLDNYMGVDCIYYQYLGIPAYRRRNMYPEKMVPDVFYALGMYSYPFKSEKNHLLDHMIHQGKLVYFSEAMCPEYPDSTLIGFSRRDIEWCKVNEAQMWAYLAQQKLLYDSERLTLRKFLGEAPNTSVFSSESPGRAAVWLGWQIVRAYMSKHPEASLDQLFKIHDGQAFLAASGYYPE